MNIFKRWTSNDSFSTNQEKRLKDLERKNCDLEKKILGQEIQIQETKSSLKETQISLNIVLNSYQALAEEINNIYDALQASLKPRSENDLIYSLRDYGSDDDDDGNWN